MVDSNIMATPGIPSDKPTNVGPNVAFFSDDAQFGNKTRNVLSVTQGLFFINKPCK